MPHHRRRFAVSTLAIGALVFCLSAVQAAPPAWWTTRGVTNGPATDDYIAANQGQLKQIAAQAAAELDAVIGPIGGAGTAIDDMIDIWRDPPEVGVTRDDYAALNQGQLKATAKLYYDRFAVIGFRPTNLSSGQTYPWTATTGDDDSYAGVNLGQLKFVFSFDIAAALAATTDVDNDGLVNSAELNAGTSPFLSDSDADGMFDGWEVQFGLNPLVNDASGNPDGDTLTNFQEFQLGRNPTKGVVADVGGAVNLRIYSPSH